MPTTLAPSPDLAPRARAEAGTPLYVHLPFCAAKCHYCDFFSVAAEGHDRGAMVAAILAESERWAPAAPRTVFVGGGTPSLLEVAELRTLFDGLERITGFRASAREVTVECNPESLDRDKARALLDLGATRLSIGFQALDEAALKLFGRVHDAAQSFAAFAAARAAGADDVNVDLIYAWPGQELDDWLRDLGRVLDLRPDHVSAYNLTFEEDTAFRRWLDEGVLARADEEVELAFFERTREVFAARGFEAYEVSNFARPGRRCRHNENYWRNGAYLGVGPSAVSKTGTARAGNVKSVGAYVQAIESSGSARAWEEAPGDALRLAETWWLGLRLADGIRADEARERAAWTAPDDPALPVARALAEQGLLDERGGRFVLTRRGLALADSVAKHFLRALAPSAC